jgi:hypothetical protein
MIRFLKHEMIDKSRWDDCISNAVNGNLYALSWYLDTVSPGWCALVEDEYENVFPLTVSSKAGIKYVMQPYFTQQLGLFSLTPSHNLKLACFLKSIPASYKYIDINLNTSNHFQASDNVTELTNLELLLKNEYGKISEGYHTNLLRNLKKASQNKLTIVKTIKPEQLISLFRANKGQHLQQLNDSQYKLIQLIADQSIKKGMAEVWAAIDEYDQMIAGILWVTSHQKAIFLFSALSETGKKLNAMPWLIDAFIRQNAGKPLTLDFEGSNNEGLARFYSSFGSKRVIYQRFRRTSLPAVFRIALNVWRLIRIKVKK